jgi:hypothetical protein
MKFLMKFRDINMASSPIARLFSGIDSVKRQAADAFNNPLDYLSMITGRAQEDTQRTIDLQNQALGDPTNPLRVTDQQAFDQLTDALTAQGAGAGIISPTSKKVQQWAKDSLIKDKKGNPQVMYHATLDPTVKELQPVKGMGFVTPDPNFANTHLEYLVEDFLRRNKTDVLPEGLNPQVLPVYTNAKNPFDYQNKNHVETLVDSLNTKYVAGLPKGKKYGDFLKSEIKKGNWKTIEIPAVNIAIKDLGFDSFFVKENNIKNLGFFSPKQIKSALSDPSLIDDAPEEIINVFSKPFPDTTKD